MSHGMTFLIGGLVIAAVGGLIFFGGTQLLDRQTNAILGTGSCLLAMLGAVVLFAGVGVMAAAFVLP